MQIHSYWNRVFLASLVVTLGMSVAGTGNASPYVFERSFTVPTITRLDALAFDTATERLYGVTAGGVPDRLFEFTTDGMLVDTRDLEFLPGVGGTRSLAYDSQSSNLFLGEFGAGSSIYELTPQGVLLTSFSGPGETLGGMTYNSVTDTLFAGFNTIYELRKSDGFVLNSFPAPGGVSRGLAFDGSNLVSFQDFPTATIYTLNPANGMVIDSTTLDNSHDDTGITFGAGKLYVWNDPLARVDVFVPVPEPSTFTGLSVGILLIFALQHFRDSRR